MRTLVALSIVLFIGNSLYSQNCSKYYPFEQGAKFQVTNYDKKNQVTGVIDYEVKDSSGDSAILAYVMHDAKGKLILSSEYAITCENDGISIDFNSLAAPGLLEQYKDMEVDITGTDLILPNDLSPGQSLPDADMQMNVSMPPINMKMTVNVYNRKVEGKETVTTPAGTFDCFVISYDHDSKMGVKVNGSAKQWLAEEVGMVKQENYNKKGKLTGSSVLTKFED